MMRVGTQPGARVQPWANEPSTFAVFADEMDRGFWSWASLGSAVQSHRALWGYEGGLVGTLEARISEQSEVGAAIVIFTPDTTDRDSDSPSDTERKP